MTIEFAHAVLQALILLAIVGGVLGLGYRAINGSSNKNQKPGN